MLDFLFTIGFLIFLVWAPYMFILHVNIFNSKHRLMRRINRHLATAMDVPAPLAFKRYIKTFTSLTDKNRLTIEYDYDRRYSVVRVLLDDELIAIWDYDKPEYSSKKFHPEKFNAEVMEPYFKDVAFKKGYVTWI